MKIVCEMNLQIASVLFVYAGKHTGYGVPSFLPCYIAEPTILHRNYITSGSIITIS